MGWIKKKKKNKLHDLRIPTRMTKLIEIFNQVGKAIAWTSSELFFIAIILSACFTDQKKHNFTFISLGAYKLRSNSFRPPTSVLNLPFQLQIRTPRGIFFPSPRAIFPRNDVSSQIFPPDWQESLERQPYYNCHVKISSFPFFGEGKKDRTPEANLKPADHCNAVNGDAIAVDTDTRLYRQTARTLVATGQT